MIKNIVFDMGRVLLDYDAVRVCWQYTDSSEDVELMSRELFFAEEWVLLDRGTITEEEALRRVQKRLPDERTREMARLCLAHWHEFNIEPKPGMRELVMQIKEAGCAVYLCSNASHTYRYHPPDCRYRKHWNYPNSPYWQYQKRYCPSHWPHYPYQ